MSNSPLSGLRVLELARVLAGPWCCQILADLGADVVKVESPEGDDTRQWGPPFVPGAGGGHLDSAYYHSTNRGKRSIAADFRSEEGRALVRRLAAHADIVVENFKVGGLAKFGLDYPALKALNPRLIYCSITGFGQEGPYAHRPGYDFMIQGMGGIMDVTGEPDGQPMKIGVAYADMTTGLYSTIAILAALNRRNVTGEGAYLDMALLDVQVGMLQALSMNYLVGGNAHPNLVPYSVVPVREGHIILACGNDTQFARACAILGVPDLPADPRFRSNADRIAHREELMRLLTGRTATFAKADLLAALEKAGVPAGPINTIPEVFEDPQVVHRGMRGALAVPEAEGGAIPNVRGPIVIDGTPQCAERHAPGLGQHQAEVLADPAWGGGE
jgi:crotonobetainyl-CoA:carnitine CoA-transferase CaiB-like acyl-CoA transferase